MKSLPFLVLLLLSAATPRAQSDCDCRKVGNDVVTTWGVKPYAIELPDTYPSLEGKVADSAGDAVDGALLEVFDHPEAGSWFRGSAPSGKARQKRVAACRTGEEGCFRFSLSAGEYELRVSRPGFDAVVLRVKVKPGGKAPDKPLEIYLLR
ncbi:MAG: carboxypeptidase regulatory-like domain-containing protein [Acidobacteria bacterium]|nr:carboxypeptidase regulatory-like domain-containing protein [Acidobacteriota bacterium]